MLTSREIWIEEQAKYADKKRSFRDAYDLDPNRTGNLFSRNLGTDRALNRHSATQSIFSSVELGSNRLISTIVSKF